MRTDKAGRSRFPSEESLSPSRIKNLGADDSEFQLNRQHTSVVSTMVTISARDEEDILSAESTARMQESAQLEKLSAAPMGSVPARNLSCCLSCCFDLDGEPSIGQVC